MELIIASPMALLSESRLGGRGGFFALTCNYELLDPGSLRFASRTWVILNQPIGMQESEPLQAASLFGHGFHTRKPARYLSYS